MHNLINEILALNLEINQLASQNNWPLVKQKTVERQYKIEEYFSRFSASQNESEALNLIHAIQQNDELLCNQINCERKALISEGMSLQNAKVAIREYHSHTGS